MKFRSTLALTFSALSLLVLMTPVHAAPKPPLVLQYTVQEGLSGRLARGATFKAWINDGRPVVATTDDKGLVSLDLGRSLAKGQTLFVEAESADGERNFSWIYHETGLSGHVDSSCQLVGMDDFQQPNLAAAAPGAGTSDN